MAPGENEFDTPDLLLERGEGREKNINMREIHLFFASCTPPTGPGPQLTHIP